MNYKILPDNFSTPLLVESAVYLYKVTLPVFNFMLIYSNPAVAGLAATAVTVPLIANLNNIHNINEGIASLFTEKTFYPSTFNPFSELDFSIYSLTCNLAGAGAYYYIVTKPTFNFVANHTPQGIEYFCAGIASYAVTIPALMYAKYLLFSSINSAPSDQTISEEYTNPIGWLYEHLTSDYIE